jgi:hypothetical protein
MFKITIKNFTGRTFALNVDPGSTIADVKDAIADTKFPRARKSDICLTYNGHELRNHQQLSHYGIYQGYTLQISECKMLV